MPFLAPIGAWIAANAAAISAATTVATAGTEIGLQASGALQPSTTAATQKAQLEAAQKQQQQQQTMEQSLFKHFAPDAQAQTGGALGDQSLSALISELAGTPGGVGEAQQTIFGNTGAPGTSSVPPINLGQPEQPLPQPDIGPGLSSSSVGGG